MGPPGDRSKKKRRISTEIIHAGRDPFAHHGFVNPPVYRGSTVLFKSLESFEKREQKYTYGRRGTPTTEALEEVITCLEEGARTLLASNGLSAITTAMLSFANSGDHILVCDAVYGPTRRLCDTVLKRLGIETTYFDPGVGKDIAGLMRPNTTVVFLESPGSQTFEMLDIPAMAAAAREKNAWVLMDNSWATPLYFKPLRHGVDVTIHAGTKYFVGHADAMLGTITANDRAAARLVSEGQSMGTFAGTEEVFLGLRGVRTLQVRLERHYRSGLEIGRWLEQRPEVSRVLHPALESHPGHAIWKRDFSGASGLFSIVLKPAPKKAVAAMVEGLELFGMGASWGGFESLVLPFNATPYRTATKWAPEGPTVRLHIGLEDVADLKADLEAGLARLKAAS